MLRTDVVVETKTDIPTSASVWCIKTKTTSVAVVTNRSVIWSRRKSKQLSDLRIERATRESQKVNRVQRTVVTSDISEASCACSCIQNVTVRNEVLCSVSELVIAVEEQFVLLGQPWTTFTETRQRKWTTDVKTILMLQKCWLRNP